MQNVSVPVKGEALPNRYFDQHPRELPPIYVMGCEGICLEPKIMDGSRLVFSSVEPYKPGDFVAIFKKRECTIPGDHQIVVKRLFWAPPIEYWNAPDKWPYGTGSVVLADMLNPPRRLAFDADGVLGIHKCLGPVPEGHKTFKVGDEWFEEQRRLRGAEPGTAYEGRVL